MEIVGQTPTGCRVTLEADFYYPLQMKLEDWYPPTFRSRTTTEEDITTTSSPADTTSMEYVQQKIDERLGLNGKNNIDNTVEKVRTFRNTTSVYNELYRLLKIIVLSENLTYFQ